MIDFLKQKLADKQYQAVLKSNSVTSQTSFELLSKTQDIIAIIYPMDKSKEHETNNSLNFFFKNYPNSEFILIKPSELNKDELQFSGMPTQNYFDQFKNKRINLLIDLSFNECLLSCFIAAKIDALLKVRLNTFSKGSELFHLSLNSKKDGLKDKLQCLLDYSLKLKGVV